jgi:type IV secretion system protein VirB6
MACGPIAFGDGGGLSSGLAAIDCQVNQAVTVGYGRLFAPGGAFGAVLTSLLTIYVAILAYGLITGRTRLTLSAMTPKVLALGLVLTFATAWPAYQAMVYGLLAGGPDQIASAFMGAKAGAIGAFAARLDTLFASFIEVSQSVAAQTQAGPTNLAIAVKLMWASTLTLLLATVGLLVISRVVLAVLLALGPVFIVFALFGGTRGLFEGWLRTSVAVAFAPMLIVLGGSGVMSMLTPMIDAIAEDPARAVADLQPIVLLFLGSMIYAGLLAALTWTAVMLTRGWRIPLARILAGDAPAASARASVEATTSAASPAAPPAAPHPANDPGGDRLGAVVQAVLREEGRASATRLDVAPALSPHAPAAAQAGPRRAEGLGQSFRPAPQTRPLAGSLGS